MQKRQWTLCVVCAGALLGASPPPSPLATSAWVSVGSNGHLQYKSDAKGNRILDFSSAGYGGGGVALPLAKVAATVSPISGDNTAAIQAAIDTVAKMAPGAGGLRGAVLLEPGTYDMAGTLDLAASGVVLRGSGSGAGGTVLNMTGSPHLMLSIAGSGNRSDGASVAMTDPYVPSGATSFDVSDGSKLKVGDSVVVGRPVTQAWIDFMGMNDLTSGGTSQTWIGAGAVVETDRTIAAISGNQVTLDVPLADSFDAAYVSPPGGTVTPYTYAGRITDVGVEHLQVVAPAVDVIISDPQFTGVEMNVVADSWLDDIAFQDTQNTVTIDGSTKRVTVEGVKVTHTVTHTGDRMADFGLSGTQILVDKCSSDGDGEWPLVTQGEVSGPIVALGFTSTQQAGVGPHQRWAVGLLTDGASLPNAPNNSDGGATGISYSDRGNHGSGQGWAMGWGVAWNVTTPYIVVQQPPGAENWCIGCVGTEVTAVEAGTGKTVPNGIFDSPGAKVTPGSLYLAQLCDRLGASALVNIGYTAADCGGVEGPDAGASGSGSGSGAGSGSGSSSGAGSGSGSASGSGSGSASGSGSGSSPPSSSSGSGASPGSTQDAGGANDDAGGAHNAGCACGTAAASSGSAAAGLAMFALAGFSLVRRRRGR